MCYLCDQLAPYMASLMARYPTLSLPRWTATMPLGSLHEELVKLEQWVLLEQSYGLDATEAQGLRAAVLHAGVALDAVVAGGAASFARFEEVLNAVSALRLQEQLGGGQLDPLCVDMDAWEYLLPLLRAVHADCGAVCVPMRVNGDGNCLLHAVSNCVWGSEGWSTLLRAQLRAELTDHRDFYTGEMGPEEYDRLLAEVSAENGWLAFSALYALANVLRRPVMLLCPPGEVHPHALGTVFGTCVPSRFGVPLWSTRRPVVVAWSTMAKRHFVPLLPITRDAGRPCRFPFHPADRELCAIPEQRLCATAEHGALLDWADCHSLWMHPALLDYQKESAALRHYDSQSLGGYYYGPSSSQSWAALGFDTPFLSEPERAEHSSLIQLAEGLLPTEPVTLADYLVWRAVVGDLARVLGDRLADPANAAARVLFVADPAWHLPGGDVTRGVKFLCALGWELSEDQTALHPVPSQWTAAHYRRAAGLLGGLLRRDVRSTTQGPLGPRRLWCADYGATAPAEYDVVIKLHLCGSSVTVPLNLPYAPDALLTDLAYQYAAEEVQASSLAKVREQILQMMLDQMNKVQLDEPPVGVYCCPCALCRAAEQRGEAFQCECVVCLLATSDAETRAELVGSFLNGAE